MIIDLRDGKSVEFLALPVEVIKDGDIPVPDIDFVEAKGFDGVTRGYISVTWQKVESDMVTKKYDVVGHIVTAGCFSEDASKEEDGALVCTDKRIYTVLHPIEEWMDRHVVELHPVGAPKR